MRIRLGRVIAFLLSVAALILLIRHRAAVAAAWDTLFRLGPGQPVEDKFVGMLVLGLAGACLVAVVKILSRERDQ